MGFHAEVFQDEPILMVTLDGEFTVGGTLPDLMAHVVGVLDAAPQKLFYVVDMRNMKVSFEDVMNGANVAARGAGSFLHHPNIREIVLISTDKMIALSVQGLRSPVFGLESVSLFPTVEEALSYARQQMVSA
jgi:hypothetical protein